MSDNITPTDYEKEGYDIYLSNSIAPDSKGYTNSFDFQLNTQDGSVSTAKISYLSADKVTTGVLYSNDQKTKFDLDNKYIIINDGTNDRVLLGFLSGGF